MKIFVLRFRTTRPRVTLLCTSWISSAHTKSFFRRRCKKKWFVDLILKYEWLLRFILSLLLYIRRQKALDIF